MSHNQKCVVLFLTYEKQKRVAIRIEQITNFWAKNHINDAITAETRAEAYEFVN